MEQTSPSATLENESDRAQHSSDEPDHGSSHAPGVHCSRLQLNILEVLHPDPDPGHLISARPREGRRMAQNLETEAELDGGYAVL